MLNRIQRVMDYHKLTSSAFADKIGVPRSTISHILSGRNNPSLDFVMKTLASFPHINTDWLVKGTGPMLKVSSSLFPEEDLDYVGNENSALSEPEEEVYEESRTEKVEEVLEFEKRVEKAGTKPQSADKIVEDFPNIVRSEDPVEYVTASKLRKNKASKVIVLYDDGTFSGFNHR